MKKLTTFIIGILLFSAIMAQNNTYQINNSSNNFYCEEYNSYRYCIGWENNYLYLHKYDVSGLNVETVRYTNLNIWTYSNVEASNFKFVIHDSKMLIYGNTIVNNGVDGKLVPQIRWARVDLNSLSVGYSFRTTCEEYTSDGSQREQEDDLTGGDSFVLCGGQVTDGVIDSEEDKLYFMGLGQYGLYVHSTHGYNVNKDDLRPFIGRIDFNTGALDYIKGTRDDWLEAGGGGSYRNGGAFSSIELGQQDNLVLFGARNPTYPKGAEAGTIIGEIDKTSGSSSLQTFVIDDYYGFVSIRTFDFSRFQSPANPEIEYVGVYNLSLDTDPVVTFLKDDFSVESTIKFDADYFNVLSADTRNDRVTFIRYHADEKFQLTSIDNNLDVESILLDKNSSTHQYILCNEQHHLNIIDEVSLSVLPDLTAGSECIDPVSESYVQMEPIALEGTSYPVASYAGHEPIIIGYSVENTEMELNCCTFEPSNPVLSSEDNTFCIRDANAPTDISINMQSGYTYFYQGEQITNETFQVLGHGTHLLKVVNEDGCVFYQEIIIEGTGLDDDNYHCCPDPIWIDTEGTQFCAFSGQIYQLHGVPSVGTWSLIPPDPVHLNSNGEFVPVHPGTYVVEYTVPGLIDCGCKCNVVKEIEVVDCEYAD